MQVADFQPPFKPYLSARLREHPSENPIQCEGTLSDALNPKMLKWSANRIRVYRRM